MNSTEALRKEVKKRIDTADEKSLRRVFSILEIDSENESWWDDEDFIKELDSRYEAMESGEDKGVTIGEIRESLKQLSTKKA
jgi:hypothetical protein